jgi:hypothetical protein
MIGTPLQTPAISLKNVSKSYGASSSGPWTSG